MSLREHVVLFHTAMNDCDDGLCVQVEHVQFIRILEVQMDFARLCSYPDYAPIFISCMECIIFCLVSHLWLSCNFPFL